MSEKPWYLGPPREGEPEEKTCLNCARACKQGNPFKFCPHWARWEDIMLVGGQWWRNYQ